MYQGYLPMINPGAFAHFYGGPELIKNLPTNKFIYFHGFYFLAKLSLGFQIVLSIFKWWQTRKLRAYTNRLRITLVENILNMYSGLSITIVCTFFVIYGVIHFFSLSDNKESKKIFFLYLLVSFLICIPFVKNNALR